MSGSQELRLGLFGGGVGCTLQGACSPPVWVFSFEKLRKYVIYVSYVYVSVNLSNQAICKLSENFRQFVKGLFQSINSQLV